MQNKKFVFVKENIRIAAGVRARALQGCTEIFIDGMEYSEQCSKGGPLIVYCYQDNKNQPEFKCQNFNYMNLRILMRGQGNYLKLTFKRLMMLFALVV